MTDQQPSSSQTNSPIEICILAAGMGTRMRSSIPKVMQPLAGRPMLSRILGTALSLNPQAVHVVVGPEGETARQAFSEYDVNWVTQNERRGTGHAVLQALPYVDKRARLLILAGDAPLISEETLTNLLSNPAAFTLLSVNMDDPAGYGRIVRRESSDDAPGAVLAIVEDRDTTPAQKLIAEINTGVMVVAAENLASWLPRLTDDNDQQELLLTDIVAMANSDRVEVQACVTADPIEVTGVNTLEQLVGLERAYQMRLAGGLLAEGVRIMDPARFDCRGELTCGKDVRIDINCIFEGVVSLGDNVQIGANCMIRDATIESGAEIRANTVLEDCHVGKDNTVGPFAWLRPGTRLSADVGIGNFVEVKNTRMGQGSKASHLAYLGDSIIGESVNIGAGTITCNYDGVNKHETRIEDNVFVGSNTALVAPVTIGADATIGAGSTITKNVDRGVLAIARGTQKTVANWKRKQ
jgi:bifunctional UDP-N-acetylglucosamine pyrophosphorylase / glucosamine-1-phosphate N-acetyltransferase